MSNNHCANIRKKHKKYLDSIKGNVEKIIREVLADVSDFESIEITTNHEEVDGYFAMIYCEENPSSANNYYRYSEKPIDFGLFTVPTFSGNKVSVEELAEALFERLSPVIHCLPQNISVNPDRSIVFS